jgi:threonine dehydratase
LTSLTIVSDAYQMQPLLDAIRPTTFIDSVKLRDQLGLDITIVSEAFQHTGSFKFRAAYNLALNVPNGSLLTASSGNFGQALAYAAKLLGKKCTVIMPETSARVKIDAVRSFGAFVDLIEIAKIARSARVEQLKSGMPDAYYASPYDDQFVIDGNSTLGDEIAEREFDAVIVPIGGGGLISGMVNGLTRNRSKTVVVGAEPLLGNDAARSLREGRLLKNETEPMTLADGARTVSVGELNWPIIRDNIKEIIEVSEERIAEAMRTHFQFANLKCEPTAALSLGAILENRERWKEKKVCVIVTGGNVDAPLFAKLIANTSEAYA